MLICQLVLISITIITLIVIAIAVLIDFSIASNNVVSYSTHMQSFLLQDLAIIGFWTEKKEMHVMNVLTTSQKTLAEKLSSTAS